MKHTPGPWNIAGGNANERTDVIKTGPGYVSHIARLHDQWICDEHGGTAFDNARLIAAAPEMLEALIDAEFLMRKSGQVAGPMQDSYNRAAADMRTIIAKAEGR